MLTPNRKETDGAADWMGRREIRARMLRALALLPWGEAEEDQEPRRRGERRLRRPVDR